MLFILQEYMAAFQAVAVNKQGIRICPSVLLQLKSATQGTMIVAMLLGSKKSVGQFEMQPNIIN